MNRLRNMLLLTIAALVPAGCATTPGPPDAHSQARKAEMRADRRAVVYGIESMEQLRFAAVASERSLRAVKAAATGKLENRRANLRRAYNHSSVAHGHLRKSDRLSNLAAARQPMRADLERLLQEQERYHRTHDRFAPAIRNLDLEPERETLRIVSADADGFVAIAEDGSTRCAMTVELDESREERSAPEIACG